MSSLGGNSSGACFFDSDENFIRLKNSISLDKLLGINLDITVIGFSQGRGDVC